MAGQLNGINLKQLEAFVAVVECGSFTEAAKQLFLVQSTVSSHVHVLESVLGAELLLRERGQITLTAKGQQVYRYAKDIVEKCRALESDLFENWERELFLGTSSVPAQTFLPELLLRFRQAYPEARVYLHSDNSEAIQRAVERGELELGFVGVADNRQDLEYVKVMEDRLVLLTPASPYFQDCQARGLLGRDLLCAKDMPLPLFCRTQGSGTQRVVYNYLSSWNEHCQLQPSAFIADPVTLRAMVLAGGAVAIMSALFATEGLRAGTLLAFDLADPPLMRSLYMVRRQKANRSALAEALVTMVKESMHV